MHRIFVQGMRVSVALCLAALIQTVHATTLQRLSFEELTDNSDMIVTGKVTRSWSAWDAGHHYIWTHYSLEVSSAQKGLQTATVEVSEPGGVAGGMGMMIAGSVGYKVGDDVLVFLQTMPNGMVRTAGWGQGKYTVDAGGRLHAEVATRGVEYVHLKSSAGVTPVATLDGLTLREAGALVTARLRTTKTGKVQ